MYLFDIVIYICKMKTIVTGPIFDELSKKVRDAHLRAAYKASLNAIALVKSRVIKTGTLSTGEKMPKYSQSQLSAAKIKSRSGSNAVKSKLAKSGKFTASYEEIRVANNLQVQHRDLKFTGRMWANIKPHIKAASLGLVKIDINADQSDEIKKVENNIERTGNFLLPSKSELDIIKRSYNNEFINELTKIL